MAKNLPPAEVQAILVSGNFHDLIGAIEDEHFECKTAPYQLAQGDSEKQELAKDVSAIANLSARLGAPGGHILLGVQTRTSEEHHGDVVVAVHPFQQGLVDRADYHQIIESWLVARPEAIRITWYPSSADPARGIVDITIPPQGGGVWPFLVRKVIDGGRIVGNLVGYYERRADGVVAASAEEIHRLMRDGRRDAAIQELSTRLRVLEEHQVGIAPPPPQPPGPSQALQLYRQRRGEAIAAAGLNNVAAFALTSAPIQTVALTSLFRGTDSLVQLLRNPPQLRGGGWTPRVGEPEIVRGELRRALGRQSVLDCYPDGTVIFGADVEDFLCWGTQRRPNSPLKINPLALAEATYTFADLIRHIYSGHAEPAPSEVELGFTFYRLGATTTPLKLTPGGIKSWGFITPMDHHLKSPPEDTREFAERVAAEWTPGEAAYGLLRLIYAWFGLEEENIPYVADQNGTRVIAPEKLLADVGP